MTTADEANSILSTVDTAARKVRATRPTRAVPLLVLGLVIVGAMPFYVLTEPTSQEGAPPNQLVWSLGGMMGTRAGACTAIYWIIALPVAYGFIAWWYRRAAQRDGVAINVKPLVITGVALFALLLVLLTQAPTFLPGDIVIRGLTPILTMAVGLFVWSVAERSKGLLAVALVFLGAAISTSLYDFGNVVPFVAWDVYWQYSLLPNVALCASILLVSSAIYAVVERRDRTIA
jgi:hypothetical protein